MSKELVGRVLCGTLSLSLALMAVPFTAWAEGKKPAPERVLKHLRKSVRTHPKLRTEVVRAGPGGLSISYKK